MHKRDEKLNGAVEKAAGMLAAAERVLILTHKSPDGDTVGSAFALLRVLLKLGKKAGVINNEPFPEKYGYLAGGFEGPPENPDLIVATDIASVDLMGEGLAPYAGRVSLCIDHHPSNGGYAAFTLLDPKAAATCEIMVKLIEKLGVEIDGDIAACLYTGLATDTGCFRYSNVTPDTLRTAAEMIERGADAVALNKRLFETVTRARLELEKQALSTLEYHFGGKAAVITLTRTMQDGVDEAETEGIPAIPSRIEGVVAGITLREKENGCYKVSLRTCPPLNASDICARLGGGGHAAAAGCRVEGGPEKAKRAVLGAVGEALKNCNLKGEGE